MCIPYQFFPSYMSFRQNLHGLVQRLVQKERLVVQLQSELDHLKSSNPVENRESVRFSRIPMSLWADFHLHSSTQQLNETG